MEKNKTLTQTSLTFGIPFILLFSYGYLAIQHDLRMVIPLLVGITALIISFLSFILYWGEKNGLRWSPGFIIVFAVVFRLLFIVRPPEVSDDIYRYLWDGLQMLNGHNPYSFAPADIRPFDETAAHLLRHMNHPHLVSIYPPAAQMIFAVGAMFSGSVTGLKIVLFVIDITTCILLLRMLSTAQLPAWRAALYAWHPLPVLEIAASGHTDGAGILFFLLSISLLITGSLHFKPVPHLTGSSEHSLKQVTIVLVAGALFSCAVLVKLFPIIFLPAMIIFIPSGSRFIFIIGILSGTIALTFPFMPDIRNMFITLNIYIQTWEFSGLGFRALRNLSSTGDEGRMILGSLFIAVAIFFSSRLWFILRNHRTDTFIVFIKAVYCITLAFLFFTPTLHPWYALYLVCLFPLVAGPGGMLLSWSVFLAYHVQINYSLLGHWKENDAVTAAVWLAPAAGSFLAVCARILVTKRFMHSPPM